MLSALAMVAYLVQPGDTLSGIAASHGVSLAAVESANPQIRNFNIIYQGQSLQVPSGDHTSSLDPVQGSAQSAPVQKHNVTPAPVSGSEPTQAPAHHRHCNGTQTHNPVPSRPRSGSETRSAAKLPEYAHDP